MELEKQDSSTSSVPRVTVGKGPEPQVRMFVHKVCVQGSWCNLRVPLTIPYIVSSRELAIRLINSHKLPCYLEEELCAQLEAFGRQETLSHLDQSAEDSSLYEGSVLEEVTVVTIQYTHRIISYVCVKITEGIWCQDQVHCHAYFEDSFWHPTIQLKVLQQQMIAPST